MKKIFLAVLVLGFVSAQVLFAADSGRKGYSFYSKKQSTEEKAPIKIEEKAPVTIEERVVAPEKLAAPKKIEEVSKSISETVKIEAAAVHVDEKIAPEVAVEVKKSPKVAVPEGKAEPVKAIIPEKAPVKVSSAEQKHQENLSALTQRFANNKSMTDAQKNDLAEALIAQYPKDIDFRAKEQEKTVLFFESAGNDPNMTIEQKKQVIKKGPAASLATEVVKAQASETKAMVMTSESAASEAVAGESTVKVKEAPKKYKFF